MPIAAAAALITVGILPTPAASADDEQANCRTDGSPARYVVLFEEGTSPAAAEREIDHACGEPVTYYEEIGVGVATSADEAFGDRIGADRAFSAQLQRRGENTSNALAQRPLLQPTDPGTVDGADRTGDQWNLDMINAGRSAESVGGLEDVTIGVLDSGIDAQHPELADAVDPTLSAGCLTGAPKRNENTWRPTTSAHGTNVAGAIAASDDGAGVTGVAPGVTLASVKVIDDRGFVDPEAAVCGLMWAADKGMAVTNSSFFVDPWSQSCPDGDGADVMREAIARASDHASKAGTVQVAAATNEAVNLSGARSSGAADSAAGADDPGTGTSGGSGGGSGPAGSGSSGCEALPASLPSVLAVSSVDADRTKATDSSYGLGVISLAAPGGDDDRCIPTTVPGGYSDVCGTSMAAGQVAGVAAMISARDDVDDPDDVRRVLASGAQPTTCPADYDRTGDGSQDAYCTGYRAYNGFYGHGIVDAAAIGADPAADKATSRTSETASETTSPPPSPPPEQERGAPAEPSPQATQPAEPSAQEDDATGDDEPAEPEPEGKTLTDTVGEITDHLGSVLGS